MASDEREGEPPRGRPSRAPRAEAKPWDGDTVPDGTHAGGRATAERLGIDVALLELLVCPLGGEALVADGAAGVLISRRARLAYTVRDGVPILTPGEATPLEEHDPRLHPRGGLRRGP